MFFPGLKQIQAMFGLKPVVTYHPAVPVSSVLARLAPAAWEGRDQIAVEIHVYDSLCVFVHVFVSCSGYSLIIEFLIFGRPDLGQSFTAVDIIETLISDTNVVDEWSGFRLSVLW